MPCSGTLNCGKALSRASCARQSKRVAPVRHQLLQVGEVGAVGPRLAGRLVGPARAREALAQIGDRRVGHVQLQTAWECGSSRSPVQSRAITRSPARGRQPSGTGSQPSWITTCLASWHSSMRRAPGARSRTKASSARRQAGAKTQREAVFCGMVVVADPRHEGAGKHVGVRAHVDRRRRVAVRREPILGPHAQVGAVGQGAPCGGEQLGDPLVAVLIARAERIRVGAVVCGAIRRSARALSCAARSTSAACGLGIQTIDT